MLRAPPPPAGEGGQLAPRFILVANTEAADGGEKIIAGNERVIRARLSDALYFWQTDQKSLLGYETHGTPLDQRMAKLRAAHVIFHEKLGTQGERIERIKAIARGIADTLPALGADPALALRAAELCKADLMTEVVGEFPELQGLMGKYYAAAQGEHPSVALACEDHYKPQGPSDRVPSDPVAIAVALADKLDTLVGFWMIDEKPTGSKDPFALRRAALGVIRIVLENRLPFALNDGFFEVFLAHDGESAEGSPPPREADGPAWQARHRLCADLLSFFHDRLKVQLRDQGARHDLVDAVLAQGGEGQDDLLLITRRVDALAKFLATDDGKNLLAGVKRAQNILAIEEKKDGVTYAGRLDPSLYKTKEERELATSIVLVRDEAAKAVAEENFEQAMHAISTLRPFVDAFFDKVTVNSDMADLRENRLKLLNEIRETTRAVADFSKIAG